VTFPRTTISKFVEAGVAEIKTGPFGTQLKASEYTETGTPVINVRNIGFGSIREAKLEHLPPAVDNRLKAHRLMPEDIVFGRKGAVERHAYIQPSQKGWIQGSDCIRLRFSDHNEIIPRFLSYWLLTPQHAEWMHQQCSHGATMASLNQGIVERIELPFPLLSIQKRIAGILSAYDDLIEVNTRRIKAFEEMARRTYEEWFERGVKDNWPSFNFENIADIHRGKSYRSADLVQSEHSVPLINLKNIRSWGGFRRDGFKTYSGDAKSKHHAVPGDLLLAVTDMTQERRLIAECAKVPKLNSGHAVFSMDLVKVRPKKQVEKTFFYGFLRWSRFSRTLKEFANGANVLHLSPKAIAAYEFELPPMKLQLKYRNKVQPMLQLMESLEAMNTNLRAQRDLLLPRLISGEIDVSDAPLAENAE